MNLYTDPINIKESSADSRKPMSHQIEAIDSLNKYFNLNGKKNVQQNGLLVMPTGSGKTFTAVNWLLNSGVARGYRILWLAHRQELIDQTNNEFRNQAPALAKYGIKKLRIIPVSGIHFKMSQASRYDINICSISSVANKYGYRFIKRMLGEPGLEKLIVVIDEAHHAVSPSYQKVLKRITQLNPNRILLGLTATPTRMQDYDRKRLFDMFNVTVNAESNIGHSKGYIYEVTLKNLLISGFLANPVYKKIETNIAGEIEYLITEDDEAFFNKFGELSEKLKDQIAKSSSRNKFIVKQYLDNKNKYGKTIIFALNQNHCRTLYEEFKKAGVKCDYVISDKVGAQDTIRKFKENKFDVLINVQILTEGSDIPDVETIFLTRQTNSDSLLMQMIGRGLRGPAVGGTKEVNIIDFHDTWDKFVFWLDPEQLVIESIGDKTPSTEVKNNNDNEGVIEIKSQYTPWDIYIKLYNRMKANVISKEFDEVLPVGWYAVLNENGEDVNVLVYEDTLDGFKYIEKFKDKFIKGKVNATAIISICFNKCNIKPKESGVKLILDKLYEDGEMPIYYTFEEREVLDPKIIAAKMNQLFVKDEEKEEWLKEIFESTPLLKQIYKLFYIFKKTVFNSYQLKKEAEIKSEDERIEYNIIDNMYDLEDLLDEVLKENTFLNKDNLLSIEWSDTVVKSWLALCCRWTIEDEQDIYKIYVNKLMSSSQVDREVIKYLIYHELLHKNGFFKHDDKFRELEWKYPNSEELDGFMDEMAIRYKLDIPNKEMTYESQIADDVITERVVDIKLDKDKDILSKDNDTQNVKKYKYCRNCGNRLPKDANLCDKCGNNTRY
ncbi:DEAD/DEAH box helicase family protein [Asaccharospora irregularis]|uniref:Superfamily II DNA or RNA helicase n=1 Tax=Asaccharospora irregularis DSM 2635 TaxID=1121321 RepID=A0A1M5RSU3_9FIRM|nr:DEAD/DEAH box helicase family protein [Asaccharospora irregularis]SHH29316.1 Superfamily II DNA or RNA helicase [Asaccharospora irregularis DSM 2635]